MYSVFISESWKEKGETMWSKQQCCRVSAKPIGALSYDLEAFTTTGGIGEPSSI